jgi:hypothetical protein
MKSLFLSASYVLAGSLLVFPNLLPAQTSTNASIAGIVSDPSGAVVPNVAVSIRNTDTGVARSTLTNDNGLYYVSNLIPGSYEVILEMNGFEKTTIRDIHLVIEQQARIDTTLTLQTVGKEVLVTAAPPLLQTEDASVSTVIGNKQVVDLPLNGRQFTQLLQLSPGTLPATYDYLFANKDPMAAGTERNGMPAYDINGFAGAFITYRLDGVDNSEMEFGGANIPVSIDAIGEVRVQTANFSTEYGHGPSQVDVSMKSGTNS